MNHFVPIEEMIKRVVHPCDQWARGAHHKSWSDAVLAMKGGKILCGPAPRMGKSTLNVTMFLDQIKAEGLHSYATDINQVFLGLKENFSPSMLARQEQEEAQFASQFNPLT